MRPHLASLISDFRRHGRQTAIVTHSGNRRFPISYADLATLSARFAAELDRRHIALGDRVLIWGANSAEWAAVFFGCILRGVIAVPLDAAGSVDFAEKVIAETSPKLLVASNNLLTALHTGVPGIEFEHLDDLLPSDQTRDPNPAITLDTPLQIVFTSGTTSEPKGIVHNHRNILASIEPIEREMQRYLKYERPFHPIRFLHTLPLSHVFGQFMGLWIPPLMAAEVHFESRLQAPHLIALIRRERISVLAAVPRVLELLKTHLLNHDPRLAFALQAGAGEKVWKRWWRFRAIHHRLGYKFWALVCGGASLPAELERFWNTLGYVLIQGYGMTETAALVTLNHPFKVGQGTIGKPLPGRDVRLTSEGEILVRGDMLARSTWQRGALQQREDEWLATGDLAAEDASGQLRFLGRKSDVIVTAAGLNIHPTDIEAALLRQPGVRAAAVVGYQSSTGPEPAAALLFDGDDAALTSAVAEANAQLADFQQVRRYFRWPDPDFPRTTTGKLLRRVIAARVGLLQNGTGRPSADTADALRHFVTEATGQDVSGLDENAPLPLDSLARVQIQSTLQERLGIELDDAEMQSIATLSQLRARILPHPTTAGETTPQQTPRTGATALARRPGDDSIYPKWPWTWPVRLLRIAFLELIAQPVIRFLAAPRVQRNTDPLPRRPSLVIANHVTAYDAALILYALPRRIRTRIAVAMSGELLADMRHARKQGNWLLDLTGPIQYLLITALYNVFPLPNGAGFRRSFQHAGEALDHGYHVLIFPEGRRSPDGSLQPFRPGIGLLVQESATDVVAVGLEGLGELKNRATVKGSGTRSWIRSGRIVVRVGGPVSLDNLSQPAAITRHLEASVRNLLAEE